MRQPILKPSSRRQMAANRFLMLAGNSSKRRKLRLGVTLVELVLAIALSAVLLVTLVGVLSGIAKQSKIVDRFDQPVWPARVMNLIRRDLLASDTIWRENDVVWMTTDAPVYRDRVSADSSDSIVGTRQVGYHCRTLVDGSSLLLRVDKQQPSVLAIGPTQIVLERLDKAGEPSVGATLTCDGLPNLPKLDLANFSLPKVGT